MVTLYNRGGDTIIFIIKYCLLFVPLSKVLQSFVKMWKQ